MNSNRKQNRKVNSTSKRNKGMNLPSSMRPKSAVTKLPLKCVDTAALTSTTTFGGFLVITLPISQGLGINQRTGDEVILESIECHRTYYNGDPNGNVIRFILFQAVGDGSTLTTISSILSPGPTSSADAWSMIKPMYNGAYIKVIHDETISTSHNSSTEVISRYNVWKPSVPRVVFQPASANAVSGPIYVMLVSDSAIAPNPSLWYNFRVWFRDV